MKFITQSSGVKSFRVDIAAPPLRQMNLPDLHVHNHSHGFHSSLSCHQILLFKEPVDPIP